MSWIEIAKEKGYEGAGILRRNLQGEVMFMLFKDDDENIQAEIPGGKPEAGDVDAKATVTRELKEETGFDTNSEDWEIKLESTGGKSGMPSIQFISTKNSLTSLDDFKPKEKYFQVIWSKIHTYGTKKGYYVMDEEMKKYAIRKFNCFFIDQHFDEFMKLGMIVQEKGGF